jgi:hypothetical protein
MIVEIDKGEPATLRLKSTLAKLAPCAVTVPPA